MANFKSDLSFFGGIFKIDAEITWKWDMTLIEANFRKIKIAIIELSELKMKLEAENGSFKKGIIFCVYSCSCCVQYRS